MDNYEEYGIVPGDCGFIKDLIIDTELDEFSNHMVVNSAIAKRFGDISTVYDQIKDSPDSPIVFTEEVIDFPYSADRDGFIKVTGSVIDKTEETGYTITRDDGIVEADYNGNINDSNSSYFIAKKRSYL